MKHPSLFQSTIALVISVGSISGAIAPFYLLPELRSEALGRVADASWLGVSVVLAILFVACVWVGLAYSSVSRLLDFISFRNAAIGIWASTLAFAKNGVGGLLKLGPATESGASSPVELTPMRLALVAGLASFAGMTAIDGLMQIGIGRLILPPIAVEGPQVITGILLALVCLSPLLETAVMAAILEALRRMGVPICMSAAVSTIAWATWHGYINHPAQAPSIAWGFWIFSMLYLRLRVSASFLRTAIIVAAAHAINNLLALLFALGKQSILSL